MFHRAAHWAYRAEFHGGRNTVVVVADTAVDNVVAAVVVGRSAAGGYSHVTRVFLGTGT